MALSKVKENLNLLFCLNHQYKLIVLFVDCEFWSSPLKKKNKSIAIY